jgi:hypothetical protein
LVLGKGRQQVISSCARRRRLVAFAISFALFTPTPTSARGRRPASRLSSAYGGAGGQFGWELAGIAEDSIGDVRIRTQTVCPVTEKNGGVNADRSACEGSYLFLYQITSGPSNLVLTFSNLSGFAFKSVYSSIDEDSFGVLRCGQDGTPGSRIPNMLCTQNLGAGSGALDPKEIWYDASAGSLVVTVPAIREGDTLTFYVREKPLSETDPEVEVLRLTPPDLSIAGVEMSPPSLPFGSQRVDSSSAPQTIAVTNRFAGALVLSNIATTSGFEVAGDCQSLEGEASCPLTVAFRPTGSLEVAGALELGSDSPVALGRALLGGLAHPPGLSVSPSFVLFGSAPAAGSSEPPPPGPGSQIVRISNPTSASIGIGTISIVPTDPLTNPASPDFVFSDDSGCASSTLQAGGACDVSVDFAPKFAGSARADLRIEHTSPGAPRVVRLSGTANAAGTATTSRARVDFADQEIETTSEPESLTITNVGEPEMAIVTTDATSPFRLASDGCSASATLPQGQPCLIGVVFEPPYPGEFTGYLTVASDLVDGTLVVPLRGKGLPPPLWLTPRTLDFQGVVVLESGELSLTAKNTISTPLEIGRLAFGGAEQFTMLPTSTCQVGATLMSDETCSIDVAFSPVAEGAQTATVAMADTTEMSPQAAQITGRGTDFLLSLDRRTINLRPGVDGSAMATVMPQSGFRGELDVTCSVPAGFTCTTSTESLTLSSDVAAQVEIEVSTSSESAAGVAWDAGTSEPLPLALVAACALMYLLVSRSRAVRCRAGRELRVLCAALWVCLYSTSCGPSDTPGTHADSGPTHQLSLTMSHGLRKHTATLNLVVE